MHQPPYTLEQALGLVSLEDGGASIDDLLMAFG